MGVVYKVIGLFTVALGCSVLAAFLAGDLGHLWWHIATLCVGLGIFLLGYCAFGFLRRILWALPLIGHMFLTLAVLAWSLSFSDTSPSFILLANENSLAAALVVLSIATLTLWQPLWLVLFQALTGVAVLITGSRMGVWVYLFGLFLTMFHWNRQKKLVVVGMLVVSGLIGWFVAQPRECVNLLKFSNDFQQSVWRQVGENARLDIAKEKAVGPFENTQATLLKAMSDPQLNHGIALVQGSGYSRDTMPYTASVYLRADTAQKIILRNHAGDTQIICDVTQVWQRCVTPVGYANGKSSVQLQLRTLEPGHSLEVYIWGPQLEIGTEPSPAILTEATLWERLLYRLPLRLDAFEPQNVLKVDLRVQVAQEAWKVFLAHPVAGVGLGGLTEVFAAQTFDAPAPPAHAHNLVLQLLAETGLLGFASWLLTFWGTLFVAGRKHWKKLAPLVISVLLLNIVDFTYYTNVAYYAFWLTLGLVTSPQISFHSRK